MLLNIELEVQLPARMILSNLLVPLATEDFNVTQHVKMGFALRLRRIALVFVEMESKQEMKNVTTLLRILSVVILLATLREVTSTAVALEVCAIWTNSVLVLVLRAHLMQNIPIPPSVALE